LIVLKRQKLEEGKCLNVLVTGATGFVGKSLVASLAAREGIKVSAAVRRKPSGLPAEVRVFQTDGLGVDTDWSKALEKVQVVVHAAARVHVMEDSVQDPLSEYRKINLEGTLNLARQAASAKVERFIFLSTIKVNGESTAPGRAFKADDSPDPADAYGISKWETEVGLRQLAAESGMEFVIIRPPLVYGPGVRANFERMIRWINRGLPLPLGSIANKRSLVAIDNLVDLVITCIDHRSAANQTFLAGDGQDVSTPELLRAIGHALGKPARLLPCPTSLLVLVASLLGKKAEAQRLTGNLQVDISKASSLLGWQPVVSLQQGLREVAQSLDR
jgi:nucleoside-diphosphate-sugar epimerase